MKHIKKIIAGLAASLMLFTSCNKKADNNSTGDKTGDTKINIVTTTTMIADLTKEIGKEHVTVNGLMQTGVDPHLYQASAGDVQKMQSADVVIYNGLHLEGKMGEVFESLEKNNKTVICVSDSIPEDRLLSPEDGQSVHDPHIWFDASLWKYAAEEVTDKLSQYDPDNKNDYENNLKSYIKELDELEKYIFEKIEQIPKEQRVLVTAHDAFQYFSKRYGIEVKSLQGISTDSEAGTADVSETADFIVERQIKAIFIESSVPPKTIEALQDAVKAKGFETVIGGELYSDSLGSDEDGHGTYILTVKANVDIIVDALK